MRVPLEWLQEYVAVDVPPEVLAERLVGVGLSSEEIVRVGDDVVLDLEVTSNRPDCMSMIGVAREVGLLLGHPVRYPAGYSFGAAGRRALQGPRATPAGATRDERGARAQSQPAGMRSSAEERVRVDVEDTTGCPRFTLTVVEDIRVGPSPAWMQRRLEAAGVRAINNVVDVTNYVMLEIGQPMHAFDYDRVDTCRLGVRRAKPGETLETLDGVVRTLEPDMLVVTDGVRPVSIAGIIGGGDTEIGLRTTTILLEAAYWNPPTIGRTARRLGARTEAAARFERGTDPNAPPQAQARAALLLAQTSGGRVLRGMVDVYPVPVNPREIRLRPDRAVSVLGVEIPPGEMIRILRALGCRVTRGRVLTVDAPTFRPDLVREEDLVEEIIRVYGYGRVPATLPFGDTTPGTVVAALSADRLVRETMARCGLSEATTFTLVRAAPDDGDAGRCVTIANPLTQDNSALRRSLIPGLLDVLATNAARRLADVQVFELGRVFLPGREDERPSERRSLAVALMGRWRTGWNVGDEHALVDFYHLRWIWDILCRELAVPAYDVEPSPQPAAAQGEDSRSSTEAPRQPALADGPVGGVAQGSCSGGFAGLPLGPSGWWHPGRSGDIRIGDRPVARLGELHPDRAALHKLPHRAYIAEIDLEALYALVAARRLDALVSDQIPALSALRSLVPPRSFGGLPRYPEIERDLAAVVAETLPAGRVEAIIREAAGPLLEAIELFDAYTGPPIPAGHRNLAYRLRLRAPDRTLAAADAEEILDRVRIALRTRAGAQLRE